MGSTVEVLVPDIGDFEGVEVIEVLVAPGDRVARDASLITIESDKASMEIPSPRAGVVREISVDVGSRVSQGSLILRLEPDDASQPERAAAASSSDARRSEHAAAAASANETRQPPHGAAAAAGEAPQLEAGEDARIETVATPRPARSFAPSDRHAEVVVLGAGPGGYTAAFRAADLGKQVVLIERYATLGGVCLNVGCIPSKALLHIAEVISDARALRERGVEFGEPRFDLARVRESVGGVVGNLTRNLGALAQRRKISVLQGIARFNAPDQISVETTQGATTLSFEDCIIAAGSQAVELPGISHDDPRVMDSTAALRLDEIPARLLVIGGGIIGLELAAVYHALGSRISIVELTDELLPGVDRDLVKPLHKQIAKRYERILLGTRVARIEPGRDGLLVQLEGGASSASERFDRVLVAVGRRPNGHAIEARKAGVTVDERGYIPVDARMRTNVPHIYAVGDIVGQPMLAHKASHEGKTAAEVIAGLPAAFDPKAIPSVAYTDPEVAWAGLSEAQARASGIECESSSFPWVASGRAQGTGRSEGVTKLLFDPQSRRLLGAGITGRHAGELIAEAVLALELGADAEDLALTIHAHPTLSETLYFASEMFEGTITDLYLPRRTARSGRT